MGHEKYYQYWSSACCVFLRPMAPPLDNTNATSFVMMNGFGFRRQKYKKFRVFISHRFHRLHRFLGLRPCLISHRNHGNFCLRLREANEISFSIGCRGTIACCRGRGRWRWCRTSRSRGRTARCCGRYTPRNSRTSAPGSVGRD